MSCDIQTILTEAKCLITAPRQLQWVYMADQLCQIKNALSSIVDSPCDVQTSLTRNACFINLPRQMQLVAMADLLCQIKNAAASGGGARNFFVVQSDNGLWYELSAIELMPGVATLSVDQTPVGAGTQPARIVLNATDLLNYEVSLTTTAGVTDVTVGQTPIGSSLTPTDFITTGAVYRLGLVTDSGFVVWTLEPL